MSIPDYCLSVWSVHTKLELDHLQKKVNRFLLNYYHPVSKKKKKSRKKNSKLVCVNDLLKSNNFLTIYERRQMTLARFVRKELAQPIFDKWFVKSMLSDYPIVRLKLDTMKSKQYNNSVKASSIMIWNQFVSDCKPTSKTGGAKFLRMCAEMLVKKRDNYFV